MISGGGNGSKLTDKDLGALTAVFGLSGLLELALAAYFSIAMAPILLVVLTVYFAAFALIGLLTYYLEGGEFDLCWGAAAAYAAYGFFTTGLKIKPTGLTDNLKSVVWFLKYSLGALGISCLVSNN